MSTIEERLQTLEQEHRVIEREHQNLEQEHAQLKKTIELQTIAIGALVNKAALEKLNEKYDKLFEVLITHDRLTNEQLAELRSQQIELDGKIVGLQTETRQHFIEQNNKVAGLDSRVAGLDDKVASLQTEVRQSFSEQNDKFDTRLNNVETLLTQILARLPE
jgi:hypothetical protein